MNNLQFECQFCGTINEIPLSSLEQGYESYCCCGCLKYSWLGMEGKFNYMCRTKFNEPKAMEALIKGETFSLM